MCCVLLLLPADPGAFFLGFEWADGLLDVAGVLRAEFFLLEVEALLVEVLMEALVVLWTETMP